MSSSMGRIIPYIMENLKKNVPNRQPDIYYASDIMVIKKVMNHLKWINSFPSHDIPWPKPNDLMAMILLMNVNDIHIRIIPQSISKWLCPKIPDAPIGKMLAFCVPSIYTLPVN